MPMDEWMDEWIHGWMDGRTEEQMGRVIMLSMFAPTDPLSTLPTLLCPRMLISAKCIT